MNKADILVAEIGSTISKVKAFALAPTPQLIGHGESPTTVSVGDVTVGLQAALRNLVANSDLDYDELGSIPMWASSSAAGGLRMTVHGLVWDMTARAAREAALGAGAIIHLVTAGKLTSHDLSRIKQINPNTILLTGGVEHGDKETVIYNAHQLAGLDMIAPIIYAGNSDARQEIAKVFNSSSKRLVMVDNVYPRLDELNIEPTRNIIQQVFESHIVNAPGMEHISRIVSRKIMPTPGAVMEAARLLASDIGDLMVIDMGGATTDVHSVTEGSDEFNKYLTAPEPTAKRTVEGDLGLFISAKNVVSLIGENVLTKELGSPIDDLPKEPIPSSQKERQFTVKLAEEIVTTAVGRHAGRIKHLYCPTGRITVVHGKDLSQVRWIVGTGGFLSRYPEAIKILSKLRAQEPGAELLPPTSASILIDRDYVMSSAGVIAETWPVKALALLKNSLMVDYHVNAV
ncbi:GlmL-related ornithine degradation protein [Chloroflexota bacterium]